MDQIDLTLMARRHWERWLPKKARALKESGEFNQAVNTAVADAQRAIFVLKQLGYQEHQAGDVALAEFILLKPEPKNSRENRELAAQEQAYQRTIKVQQ